jgi:maleamate amidohydrolase
MSPEKNDTLSSVRAERQDVWDRYSSVGIGARYGFGEKAALVVIDMANAFNDPQHPIGADQESAMVGIEQLLEVTRSVSLRTYFFTTAFHEDLHDAGTWVKKIPVIGTLQLGTPEVDIDERLARRDDEPLVVKKASSCFFGTPFATWLHAEGIDTLVVTGTSTSGCVRATCLDAASHGFRVIVPEECVCDRLESVHRSNLFDIDSKYADVMPLSEVCAALAGSGA